MSSLHLPNNSTTEYSIESLSKVVSGTIYPFTQEGDRGVSVKGTAVRSGVLRPVHNATYSAKMKARSVETAVKDRKVRRDARARSEATSKGVASILQNPNRQLILSLRSFPPFQPPALPYLIPRSVLSRVLICQLERQ